MLYRFREAQAAELGLGTRADRRPKMAIACKSLRECERWRGEILREISRKVSKIQDAGLTDYEVRDVNDDINKLMREKRHWENQIVALGGANYRRNVPMIDEDGKEVPGTKGYKYFGRAKELPGVKELFQSKKKEEEEENIAQTFYKKFMNQGPSYYGDLDEADGTLLEYEMAAEEEEWADAYRSLQESLGIESNDPIPKLPRPQRTETSINVIDPMEEETHASKRKHPSDDVEMSVESSTPLDDPSKRPKIDGAKSELNGQTPPDPSIVHAKAAAAYIPFLTADMLIQPKMPTRDEMENILLGLRKKLLVEEYFGNEDS